jgi:hypothetical protein
MSRESLNFLPKKIFSWRFLVHTQLKAEKHSRGSYIESEPRPEAIAMLIEEIQALLAPHGVETEAVATAFKEILLELGGDRIRDSMEELRAYMLGTIVWKIFAPGSTLWICPQTKSGNAVSVDLLVTAYSLWKSAVHLAERHGVDSAAAADALVYAAHATADRLVAEERHKRIGEVRDARNYMFSAFMYLIPRIAAQQGPDLLDFLDFEKCLARWEFSDRGAFMEALESKVLCRELLNAIQPKAKSVVIARYLLGYSWEEIADCLNTSINAAQKTLSSGIRNAFGVCMRE